MKLPRNITTCFHDVCGFLVRYFEVLVGVSDLRCLEDFAEYFGKKHKPIVARHWGAF